jgi:hypothetical protein
MRQKDLNRLYINNPEALPAVPKVMTGSRRKRLQNKR